MGREKLGLASLAMLYILAEYFNPFGTILCPQAALLLASVILFGTKGLILAAALSSLNGLGISTMSHFFAAAGCGLLLRRYNVLKNMDQLKSTLQFLLLAGVLTPALASTLGWKGWIQEALGILLVTPCLLAALNGSPPLPLKQLPSLVLSLLLTGLVFWVAGAAYIWTLPLLIGIWQIWGRFGVTSALIILAGTFRWQQLPLVPFQEFIGASSISFLLLSTRARNEARINALMHFGIVGIGFGTAKGEIIDMNDAFLKMLGYTRDDLRAGKISCTANNSPESTQQTAQALSELRAKGYCDPFEKEYIRKDGSRFPAIIGVAKLSELRDEHVVIVLDNTQRKQIQTELQRAKGAAESANQAKNLFLANMSHEIRTPLSAILGFTDLILLKQDRTMDAMQIIQAIKRNGEHLLRIINDILDLSKIEEGHLSIEKSAFSIHELFANLLPTLRLKAEEKGIRLQFKTLVEVQQPLFTDPARLGQILLNVIGNAIKFTDQGEVNVTVSMLEPSLLQFAIKDTGPGISEEQAGKLFEIFSQGDASQSRRYGGSGLGLALSRRLARILNGDIVLKRSMPGQGSEFLITVAAGTPPHNGEVWVPRVQAGSKAQLKGRHIMIVDDAEDNRLLLGHMLESLGAATTAAKSGRDCLTRVYQDTFDLILMDLQMPDMDGYEATRKLRHDGYAGRIVALTAHAMQSEKERCLQEGFDNYLTKPIDWQRLTDIIMRQ